MISPHLPFLFRPYFIEINKFFAIVDKRLTWEIEFLALFVGQMVGRYYATENDD